MRALAVDDEGEDTSGSRRFDGPSDRFGKLDRSGFGMLTNDFDRLDSAISAAQHEQPLDLQRSEEELEEWLRKRRELDGPAN